MIGAIIQCRLDSIRLPAKCMLKLPNGRSILEEVVYRVKQSDLINEVYIAVPQSDFDILSECVEGCIPAFHTERNVFKEFVDIATAYNIDVVVRITADCPLIEPDEIDRAIAAHVKSGVDYTYNVNDGCDVEVFNRLALLNVEPDIEHVTTHFKDGKFKTHRIDSPDFNGCSVDTLEDYIKVYNIMGEYNGSTLIGHGLGMERGH